MPIQPIDLQILFSRLGQIGKEQAVIKEGVVHYQAQQAGEMIKRSEQQEHAVTQTNQADEGSEKVKDDSGGRNNKEQKREQKRKQEEQEELQKTEILRESYLGKNVDISG